MGAYEEIGKRLGYAEENISTIKTELVTVAHSTNIKKPEINGIVGVSRIFATADRYETLKRRTSRRLRREPVGQQSDSHPHSGEHGVDLQ